MKIKILLNNSFEYFFYFYRYLGYRIFVALFLSLSVGVLDGFGLAMFIPLLQMLGTSDGDTNEDLGKLQFIPNLMESYGINFNIVSVLILILVFFSLKGVAKFIQGYVAVIYQQYFIRKIRVTNIDLMNTFKYSEFVKADTGRIQNTFSGEVEKVNIAYRSYVTTLQNSALIFVYLVLALGSNFTFAIMVSIGGAATNFIFRFLYTKTKDLSKKLTVQNHYFQGLLIQHVAFFKYLKATGNNLLFGEKLVTNINEIEYLQRKIGKVGALLLALREPLTILVVVIVIMLQTQIMGAELGTVILSLLFLYRALIFLMALQTEWNKFLGVSGSLYNMTDFVNELKVGKENNGDKIFKGFKDKISLNNVSFNYDQVQVLNSLNLEINKNETLAIVGESGSGKTTLINLLSGLMIPSKGELLIDKIPINEFNLYTYKNRIGYIAQEAPIFNDSVFNNVTFWDEKSGENYLRFEKAIKRASIFDYVMELPNKEDEFLGNNGINISGGQKQRLSIARELYKDVDFLFMDEATSALDGGTESAIQSEIESLKGQYTIIIIAHRLATIKNADRIVLLSKGKINAIGSYEYLLANNEQFQKMIYLQDL